MDWTTVHVVVQQICGKLSPTDLKSAASVNVTWLTASLTAFGANFRLAVQVPEEANDEAAFQRALLNRFWRFNDLGFKFTSASISLDSVLGYVNRSRITRLKIEYEPTNDRVAQINKFLLRLSTDFQLLEELELRPKYDDPPEEELKVELGGDFNDDAIHHRLKVIKAPIGPNSESAIDWRFLKPIRNLVELHLLGFHVKGSGHLRRQINAFLDQFEERKIPKLALELMITKDRHSSEDISVLRSFFRAIKPDTCTLFIRPDDSMEIRPGWIFMRALHDSTPHAKLAFYRSVRLWAEPELSEKIRTDDKQLAAVFAFPMLNFVGDILVRVDLHFEDGSQTFAEVERKHLRAPLIIRHGPRADGGSWTWKNSLSNYAGYMWPFAPRMEQASLMEYNTMRKYVFGPDGEVVRRSQLRPAGRYTNFALMKELANHPEDDRIQVVEECLPFAYRIWQATEFSRPRDAVKVTTEPAWDVPKMQLPVCELIIISIEEQQV